MGNHDNPAYFDGQRVNCKRWKAVPDYSVLKAYGHTILCVGGAVSIDRGWRMDENQAYWPDEKPVYDQKQLESISETCAVDTVISHTAPSFCEMTSYLGIQNLLEQDKDLLQDIQAERKVMDNICAFLKGHNHPVNQWCYGHFHESWHSEIDGVKYNMLDCLELKELR